jgi:hypothetical protein
MTAGEATREFYREQGRQQERQRIMAILDDPSLECGICCDRCQNDHNCCDNCDADCESDKLTPIEALAEGARNRTQFLAIIEGA